MNRQILWRLLFPGALILAVAWAVAQVEIDPRRFTGIIRAAFYGITVTGLFLGWRFRRSRMALCLVALAIAYQLLSRGGIGDLSVEGQGRLTRTLVGVLLPLNLLAFAWSRDRGLFTWGTLWRLSLVIAQIPACAVACGGIRRETCDAVGRPFLPLSLPGESLLPQGTILAFGMAFLVLLFKASRRGDRMDAAVLWTLIAASSAMARPAEGPGPVLFLAAGSLILVTSAVEESFRMAYHDGLTGLPSRRALDEALLRLGGRYAVAMLDIDLFKRINDRYGHEAGDQVLRMVASRITRLGAGARGFRYGGDEFAILFPGKTIRDATAAMQNMRRQIAASPFHVRRRRRPSNKPSKARGARKTRRTVRVRLSIGVAERTGRRPEPEDVLRAADEALYRAKRAGRNRVAT